MSVLICQMDELWAIMQELSDVELDFAMHATYNALNGLIYHDWLQLLAREAVDMLPSWCPEIKGMRRF